MTAKKKNVIGYVLASLAIIAADQALKAWVVRNIPLNASAAQWLLGRGVLDAPYVARQGTAMGRAGRIHVSRDGDAIWIGGATTTVISGSVAV